MEKNFKRGLIDGYFKVFDAFGLQKIGSDKYNDFDVENYRSYYKAFALMMTIMFFIILISLVSAVISVIYGKMTIAYIMVSVYLVTMIPLYYTMIIQAWDYIKTYWNSKK